MEDVKEVAGRAARTPRSGSGKVLEVKGTRGKRPPRVKVYRVRLPGRLQILTIKTIQL